MSGLKPIIVLGLAILCGAATIWMFAFNFDLKVPTSVGTFIALCVATGLFGYVYFHIAFKSRTEVEASDRVPATLPDFPAGRVDQLVSIDGPVTLSDLVVGLYLEAVLNPADVFARISEHITPNHRTVSRRVSFTAVLDPVDSSASGMGDEADVVMPLIATPLNQLVDGLRVTDENGKRVSTVPLSEQQAFVMGILRYMAWLASDEALEQYVEGGMELRIWEAIAGRDRDSAKEAASALKTLIDGQDPDFGEGDRAEALVLQVVRYHHVAVVVPVAQVLARPWPHVFRFGLESRQLPKLAESPSAQNAWFNFLDDVRLAVGVRLNRLYYPLDLAFRSRSYHIEIEGPEGAYLATQEILELPSDPGDRATEEGAYFGGFFQARRGQRRGHLYVTNASGARRWAVAANFFERSPGTFATVTLAAASASLVVVIIAIRQMSTTDATTVADSLLPALLAVPLGVTALGAIETSRTQHHPSLLSRTLTFLTLTICLITFTVAATSRFLGEAPDAFWRLIAAASIATTAIAVVSWMLRIAVERSIRRGLMDENQATNLGRNGG